jgi:hypothetical protein
LHVCCTPASTGTHHACSTCDACRHQPACRTQQLTRTPLGCRPRRTWIIPAHQLCAGGGAYHHPPFRRSHAHRLPRAEQTRIACSIAQSCLCYTLLLMYKRYTDTQQCHQPASPDLPRPPALGPGALWLTVAVRYISSPSVKLDQLPRALVQLPRPLLRNRPAWAPPSRSSAPRPGLPRPWPA